ncbi:hypothetical protein SAMN02745687_00610 [Lachnospiraceae bacterium NK3A20]|nr:hypothetical protein SAMN02745687_00610 [Lachnospiraceae bacterium NK3A20]
MSLYEMQKREQAMLHTVGGIAPDVIDVATNKALEKIKIVRRQAQTFLTNEEIEQIVGTLTDKQKKLADDLQHYMATVGSEWGNETSNKLYGYDKFTDENYFPVSTDSDTHAVTEKNQATGLINAVKNMGFTKQVVPNASNPLLIKDIFNVFTNHMSDMATYHAYAVAMNDLIKVANYSRAAKNTREGFTDSDSVQKAITKIYGDQGKQYMIRFLADLDQREKSDYVQLPGLTALAGNYKAAAVGYNIRVVAQQPTAYARAGAMIDSKYLMKALVVPNNDAKTMQNETSAASWAKKQGNVDGFIYRDMKSIITGHDKLINKARNAGMFFASKADDVTWSRLYKAVYFEQRDAFEKAGKDIGGEDFTDAVNSRFDDVIARTHVTDGTIYRSQFMRRSNGFAQMQSVFMAEPTKSYNLFLQSILDIQQNGWSGEANKKIRREFFRAASSVLMADLGAALAQSLIDANRYRDSKDNEGKNFLERFYSALMGDHFLDGNLWQSISTFNKIPMLKDVAGFLDDAIVGMITGKWDTYSNVDCMDTAALTTAVKAVQKAYQYNTAQGGVTRYGKIMAIMKAFGKLTGVQPYNLVRDITPIYNWLNPDGKLVSSKSTSANYAGMYEAIQSGKKITEAVTKRIEDGDIIYDIQGRIKGKFKDQYYDAYQNQGESEPFGKLEQSLIEAEMATGMTEMEATNEVQEWRSKDITYSVLDDAIEAGTGIEDTVAKMLSEADVAGNKAKGIQTHVMTHYGSTLRYYKDHDMYGEDVYDSLRANIGAALNAAGNKDYEKSLDLMETGDTETTEASVAITPELQASIDRETKESSKYYPVYQAIDRGRTFPEP